MDYVKLFGFYNLNNEVIIYLLLVYYICMFIADVFMPKLYFRNIVEAYDHFNISNKKTQQIVYCGGFFIYLFILFTASQI